MVSKRMIYAIGVSALILFGIRPGISMEDPGWPRELKGPKGRLVLHQPQVDKWDRYSKLEAGMVVEISPGGREEPILGALRLSADTFTDLKNRLVTIENLRITKANFPSLDEKDAGRILRKLNSLIPKRFPDVSLDRILANLERTKETERSFKGSNEPPPIFVSEKPAILLQFDGDPALYPIPETDLSFAVNTNWDLFFDKSKKRYYLLNEDTWLTTGDLKKGPWSVAEKLPKGFSKIPDDDNWASVRAHLSIKKGPSADIPAVFVSTRPSELIVIRGNPKPTQIKGTKLSYVSNTDSDLFFYSGDNNYYFLASGRWFRTKELKGNWTYAGKRIPGDFAKIPADGPKGRVLASVPGTPEAREAAIQAEIPEKAIVKRDEAELTVAYSGDPKFKAIPGTSLKYAVNTGSEVILAGGKYYALQDAVWFVSDSPTGPWEIADSIPAEIYKIPESSPMYHTTYVRVYDSTDDEVEFGYTSGYFGVYEEDGAVVYGTGYWYRPFLVAALRPIYWPRPCSYGFRAYYNPYTGNFVRGGVVYGPYRGIGRGAVYNPRTGTYARGTAVWGPSGGAWAGVVYNPSTGVKFVSGSTRRGSPTPMPVSPYARWGNAAKTLGTAGAAGTLKAMSGRGRLKEADRRRPATERLSAARDSRGARATKAGAKDRMAGVKGKGSGDLYAGKDGNIYRRSGDGNWSKYSKDKKWKPAAAATQETRAPEAKRDRPASAQQQDLQRARAEQQKLKEQRAQQQRAKQQRAKQQRLKRESAQQERLKQQKAQQQSAKQQPARQQASKQQQVRKSGSRVVNELNRDAGARSRGHTKAANYQRYKSSAQAKRYGAGSRPSRGAARGGGSRRGGRRR